MSVGCARDSDAQAASSARFSSTEPRAAACGREARQPMVLSGEPRAGRTSTFTKIRGMVRERLTQSDPVIPYVAH